MDRALRAEASDTEGERGLVAAVASTSNSGGWARTSDILINSQAL